MFKALFLTFAVTLLSHLYPIQLNWLLGAQAQEDDMFEIQKRIEMQNIKSRLLAEFGWTEVPKRRNSTSKLSPEAIEMLISEYRDRLSIQQKDDTPQILIPPENDDFKCEWSDEPSCRRFEYNLSPKLVISPSEFRFRKLQPSSGDNVTITGLCSGSEMILTKKTNQLSPEQGAEKLWEIYQLSALKELPSRKGEVTCEIEISGIAVDSEQNLPFLKASEERPGPQRKRRNEDTTGRPNTCRSTPFNFSFEALGFDDYIIHPLWFMANICEGECEHSQNQYETLMDMYFRHHPDLKMRYSNCWATCCRPAEYQDMMVIYWNNSEQVIRNFTKAIINRCTCS